METHAGIDLGGHQLHIAIIIQPNRIVDAEHLMLKDKEHAPKNLADLLKRTIAYFKKYDVKKLIIERSLVFPSKGGFPVLEMCEMLTIAKLAANKVKAEVILTTPSQWRKNVLGNGKADKKDAIAYCAKLGWGTKDHNEAESICIAFYQ